MTKKHPYVASGGLIIQVFSQLRSMLPNKIDAETLKKLSLAPKNESTVINVLKFLGFIDDECQKTQDATEVFLKHSDDDFEKSLGVIVKQSYSELFGTIGDNAWICTRDQLISFFRVHDETSAITAKRQAITFETLSSLSGHGESPVIKTEVAKPVEVKKKSKESPKKNEKKNVEQTTFVNKGNKDIGLTVRIEINLPAQGDQDTYDKIFSSIKKNLIDG